MRILRLLYRWDARWSAFQAIPRPVRWWLRRALVTRPMRRHVATCSRVKFVGVTGSVGKTTVTELVATILADEGATTSTLGNHNGVDGVPTTLRRVRPDDRFAVLEAGIHHQPGEMAWLTTFFRPGVAVLTALGDDHSSAYGSIEATAREKRYLLEAVPADGVVVANADDPRVRESVRGLDCRVVFAGEARDAEVRVIHVEIDWPRGMELTLDVRGRELAGRTQLVARHQARLVALAVATAEVCGVEPGAALGRIARLEPVPGRMRPAAGPNGSLLLMDDYKHQPAGALAGLQTLEELPARRRIVVFGDMWRTTEEVYEPVAAALHGRIDLLLVVGPTARIYKRLLAGTPLGDRLVSCAGVEDAADTLRETLCAGDVALVSGNTWQHLQRVQLLLDGADVACRVPNCRFSWRCDTCPCLAAGPPPARWVGEPART